MIVADIFSTCELLRERQHLLNQYRAGEKGAEKPPRTILFFDEPTAYLGESSPASLKMTQMLYNFPP